MKKAVSLLLAAIMVFSFISLFGVVTSSTAEAASALPKTNSEILSKYTEVVNQMKAVDKPTYRKVEYQQLNPQKQKFSSASNLAVSVAEGFLTTKEDAEAYAKQTEQGDMGGIPIYLNKNSCILKDASAIKTAT